MSAKWTELSIRIHFLVSILFRRLKKEDSILLPQACGKEEITVGQAVQLLQLQNLPDRSIMEGMKEKQWKHVESLLVKRFSFTLASHKKESFKNYYQYTYYNKNSWSCHGNFKDLYFLLSRFLISLGSGL